MSHRFALLSIVLAAGQLSAGTINVSTNTSGRYFGDGTANVGYGTGWHAGVPGEARSFFLFDLTGVSGGVTAATLTLETNPASSSYISPDPSETFTLFDVSTSGTSLINGTAGVAGFGDLGSGTQYGSVVATSATGQFVTITLNANGLAYLNSVLGGTAGFGGALTTLTSGASNEILFNGTGLTQPFLRQLTLTTADVPEPATWGLSALGLAAALLRRKRNRN